MFVINWQPDDFTARAVISLWDIAAECETPIAVGHERKREMLPQRCLEIRRVKEARKETVIAEMGGNCIYKSKRNPSLFYYFREGHERIPHEIIEPIRQESVKTSKGLPPLEVAVSSEEELQDARKFFSAASGYETTWRFRGISSQDVKILQTRFEASSMIVQQRNLERCRKRTARLETILHTLSRIDTGKVLSPRTTTHLNSNKAIYAVELDPNTPEANALAANLGLHSAVKAIQIEFSHLGDSAQDRSISVTLSLASGQKVDSPLGPILGFALALDQDWMDKTVAEDPAAPLRIILEYSGLLLDEGRNPAQEEPSTEIDTVEVLQQLALRELRDVIQKMNQAEHDRTLRALETMRGSINEDVGRLWEGILSWGNEKGTLTDMAREFLDGLVELRRQQRIRGFRVYGESAVHICVPCASADVRVSDGVELLAGNGWALGPFMIFLRPESIRIFGNHPHLNGGSICWGPILHPQVQTALAEKDYLKIVHLALRLLNSYNPTSAYPRWATMNPGRRVEIWE